MDYRLVEPVRRIPCSLQCDVLVCGGGIAGIAAALSAARAGADTVLVEKQCVLGGLATSGLVTIYLPLCDGMGHQVSYGIAEELLRLSMKHGCQSRYPKPWLENGSFEERKAERFEVQFNPVYFALEAEKLLKAAGVRIFYDTLLCEVISKDERPYAAVIENTDGRSAICFNSAVDATGTSRLMQLAGEKTRRHAKGNTVAGWYYSAGKQGLSLKMLGFADSTEGSDRQLQKEAGQDRFFGDSAEEVNEYLLRSHSATLGAAIAQSEKEPNTEPAVMTYMPQFRMIRCLCGERVMTEADDRKPCESSVGMVSDWRKRGPAFEVPYETLYGASENLFAAGRCTSVDDGMWDIMRVIPCAAVTGEAAGIAAALTQNGKRASVDAVQKMLEKSGQRLHFSNIDTAKN